MSDAIRAEIEQTDRPDRALELAFEASSDKRAVIANGANAARVLKSANLVRTLVTPWPEPLEAIDLWADNTDESSRTLPIARALTIAAYLSVLLTALFVPHDRTAMMVGIFAGLVVAIFIIAMLGIDAVVRRQVKRLDERSAFDRVMKLVTARMVDNPVGIRRAMRFLHLGLPKLV